MVFSSLEFIFHFFPIFLIVYFATKDKYRHFVLLIGSLVFYSFGQPVYLLLLAISVLTNFLVSDQIHTLVITEKKGKKSTLAKRRAWLILVLIYNFGVLFFFKYFAFTVGIIESVGGIKIEAPEWALPLGISFYTFQMLSFVFDVYNDRIHKRVSLVHFATYATMFPQIISGPITRFEDIEDNLLKNRVTPFKLERGVTLFAAGLGYKVLLADKIASLWSDISTVGPYGIDVATAWLGAWGYSFQIYFDFFGYSLMAMGIAYILGYKLPDNFTDPYATKTMTSFWRHWHMTLGKWFRDYLYIPLGGNRKGKARLVLNTFLVWMFTGIWHGASYNFLIWGLFLFLVIMLEKSVLGKWLEKSHVVGHIYMAALIPISWTIFNITDLTILRDYMCRMFGIPLQGMVVNGYSKFLDLIMTYWWLLIICIFFCTPYPMMWLKRFYKNWIVKLGLLCVFWYSIYQLITSTNNPFIYFKF